MMKMILVLSLAFYSIAHANLMAPKAGSGEITFVATASPGALAIRGKGDTPGGSLAVNESGAKLDVSGALKIKMDTLSTGLSLRDSHMKGKYLEAEKYPEALLTLEKQSLPKSGPGAFEGELTLHGVKHKVAGMAEVKLEGSGGLVKASFPVKLGDHGITAPAFAGLSVADEVKVETEFRLTAAPN